MSTEKKMNPIIPIIVIPLVGLVLLNLAFMLTAVIRISLFTLSNSGGSEPARWLPLAMHLATAVILLLISFLVLRNKKLKDIYKATFSVVPIAVVLVYTGMFLYNLPIVVYVLSAVIVAAIAFYLYKTKKPWMYFYALFLISSALLYMQVTGIDI
jgi:hypothetical protein